MELDLRPPVLAPETLQVFAGQLVTGSCGDGSFSDGVCGGL